jgi:DNA-directed RNA polymerase specialized sigma24 family protein
MDWQASNWPNVEVFERCLQRPADELAWQEFVRRFHGTIRASVTRAYRHKTEDKALRKLRLTEKTIDDLVQAVYCRLAENRSQLLKQFDPDQPGSIYRYLALISYRVVFNYFRGINRPS